MEPLRYFIDFVLHLDAHLYEMVSDYGLWVYALLFLIVFAETGFVATPFLPGDSLLFAAGTIAATGALNPHGVFLLLTLSAILGDTANYWIGHYAGARIFRKRKSLLFNPAHLDRTKKFYEKHGGKTIVLARFIPIIRTFAPFVAGIGRMAYPRFVSYNILGALLWVPAFVYAGYFFGNLPFIKRSFSLVIVAIIVISVVPAAVEFIKGLLRKKSAVMPPEAE